MDAVFMVCAAIGCTVLIAQFVLTLIGLGGETFDIDMPGDIDFDTDFDTDFGGVDASHVDSTWLFGMISFRTVVAALAFFGLAGLGAQAAGASVFSQWLVAVADGLAAMYGGYFLLQSLKHLKSEGTPRIARTVGKHGTVYTTIPADDSAAGKIQINLQNRTMEYLAMTSGHALAPGAKVVVTDVITSNTVQVEPFLETERDSHV